MGATYPTKLLLAMPSGNLCAFEDCRESLIPKSSKSNPALIGVVAHIHGEKPGTARYREDMTDDERNHPNNLIYLCPTCHTKIDAQEKDFTADYLFAVKKKHELWVHTQLDQAMSKVAFVELERAAKSIASGQHSNNSDFQVIPPEAKISKNGLTEESRSYIVMGLSRSGEVTRFLVRMAQFDDEYTTRLKNGFSKKYMELKQTSSGDELFMAMLEFAQTGQPEFKQQAASLAILRHLFHLCEVFEK